MKPFTVIDVPQRSPAWFTARLGRLTGSVAKDMLAEIKSGEAAARRDLRVQLCVERLTGRSQEDGYVNAEMQRGIDCEPLALAAYEALTGELVERTGFLSHTAHMAGASLDGHLGDFDVVVSLKCPKSATHLRYLRSGVLPPEHAAQSAHEMWLTGAQEYHFLSFDDRFPEKLKTFLVRVPRNEDALREYERKALAFLEEVNREVEAIATLTDLSRVLKAAVPA